MADRTVRVRLMADVGQFIAGLTAAQTKVEALDHDVTASALRQKDAWGKVSTGLMGVGAAAAAGLLVAVKKAADFDAQMSNVAATGQDATRNISALRQAALQAGRDFGQFSASDAADGIEQLAKAGLSAADILGGGLTGSLALAAAGQISVGEAAETTAKTLAQFELKGSDASHVADLLAAAAGKAVGDVGDFGLALAQAGTVSHQYGVSVEETVGTLALFAQNALLGSDAGTSMKNMLMMLASPTTQAQTALDQYNLAAYDAQGNFIGMAGLADQLKTHLGKLSQEQQNAALKTIFGSDAIRAASILMKSGADGVKEWTDAVNAQGFAMDNARTKMDNLKGDLRALQGSLENLLIVSGSGSQGPLRTLVQNLTGITDWAGSHQDAAQLIVELGAAVGGLFLVVGGAMKATVAISEFRLALAGLPALTAGLSGLAVVASQVAFAVGGAGLAVRALSNDWDMPGVAQAKVGLLDLSKQADSTGSSLDRMFQQADGDPLVAGVTNVDEALARMKGRWYDSLNNIADGIAGVTSETNALKEQFGKMDAALTKMSNTDATAAFRKIAASANEQGLSVEKLLTLFPQYKAQLDQTAASLGVTNLTAQDYADWMGGKIPAAISAAVAAQQSGKGATGDYTRALSDQQQAADAAAKANQALAQSIIDQANAALAASGSEIGYQAAVDTATQSIKDYRDGLVKTAEQHKMGKVQAQAWADQQIRAGKALDINTEAGRKNKSALDGIAAGALAMLQKEQEATGVTDQLRKNQRMAHDDFVRVATAMGLSKSAAEAMAKQYGMVPGVIPTDVKLTGDKDAKKRVGEVKKAIDLTPGRKDVFIGSSFDNRGTRAAADAVSGLPSSKTITITSNYNTVYRTVRTEVGPGAAPAYKADGGVMRYYAGGGIERHIAQIAPAGSWRVWAEPETGGEAYIPLAPGKRGRSLAILEEVARLFGRRVEPFAAGGFSFTPPAVTASVGPVSAGFGDGQVDRFAARVADAVLSAAGVAARDETRDIRAALSGIPAGARQGRVG